MAHDQTWGLVTDDHTIPVAFVSTEAGTRPWGSGIDRSLKGNRGRCFCKYHKIRTLCDLNIILEK
jgi:hypothetical protein